MPIDEKDIVCYIELPVKVHINPTYTKAYDKRGKLLKKKVYNKDLEPAWWSVEQALNIAYGFPDGKCNELSPDGKIVGKPMPEEAERALQDAAFMVRRGQSISVWAAVKKDGTFEILEVRPPKGIPHR